MGDDGPGPFHGRASLILLAALTLAALALAGPALAKSALSAGAAAVPSAAAAEMARASRHEPARGLDGAPPSARPPQHEACSGFDAENSPACAGRGSAAGFDRGPALSTQPPARSDAAAAQSAASAASPAPAQRPTRPATRAPRPRPTPAFGLPLIAIAGGATALVLALAALVLWLLLRGRRMAGPAVRATQPTPYRRDLILSDPEGRGWRIPGHALSPGVCVGSDPRSLGYVNGQRIEKQHVEFWVRDGRLMMRRRCSAPTFLNDRSLTDTECSIVSTGDRVRLGDSEFTLLID